MSQNLSGSTPLTHDGLRTESRGVPDKKRLRVDDEALSAEGPDLVHPRPLSWQPSAPVEPPLQAAQLRSIGVHSILNAPAKSTTSALTDMGRDGLSLGRMQSSLPASSSSSSSSASFSSAPSSHVRMASSPTVRLASPSIHHAKRPSLSPGQMNRQIIAPASPTARFVGSTGPYVRKTSTSQSPMVQSPLAQESRPGLYRMASGSPLPMDSSHVSDSQAPVPTSIHSTPTFHSRRTSANPASTPSSHETSPTTPVSVYSPFGRSSPAVTGLGVTQPASFVHLPQYATAEPISRLPSVVPGPPHGGNEQTAMGGAVPETVPVPGMIPCILDLKSGSSSQAEKRKANSDASRRFRNRKRNEMQMEQKITAQQDEIRKQQETLQKHLQEIQALMQERDHYRSERDFYREHVNRLVPQGQIPPRPASPAAFRSTSERDVETTWSGAETRPAVGLASHINPTAPQGSWHNGTSYSGATERNMVSNEPQTRPTSQLSESWSR